MTRQPSESDAALPESWAVVGGGMMGLVMALRLAEGGRKVTLIEAGSELGGLAAPWTMTDAEGNDVRWDRHYHVTLLSDSFTRGVLRDLGLEATMKWVETKTGYYSAGKLVSMSNALQYLKLPGLSLVEKVRVAGTIVYGSKIHSWRRLEQIPVEVWLTRLSGRSAFRRLWRPLLSAKLGDAWKDASAAFIWATIQRLYAARRTGLKKEMFGYVPGGYSAVMAAFHQALEKSGVTIRLATPVGNIRRSGNAVSMTLGADGEATFDRVVLTTTPRTVARLCPDLSETERQKFERIPYQGVVCASLLLRRPLADYYLTYLTDDWVPFTAVVEMSAFVDPKEFGGRTLVYLPLYIDAADSRFDVGDVELRETYESALRRIYPHFTREDLLAFRVSRVKEVFPLPLLGYSGRLPPTTIQSIPGLFAVSSAHIVNGTLNVNDTVRVAERAAHCLLRGQPFRLDSEDA